MQAIVEVLPEPGNLRITDRGQTRAPLLGLVQQCLGNKTRSYSTPGHKGGPGVPEELRNLLGDSAFASDVWFNTSDLERALGEAEQLAADTWGADSAHFLVNGATSGNLALLMAQLNPGDKVILGRDAHRSVLAGIIASGAEPVFIAPRLHSDLCMSVGIDPDDVEAAIEKHPDARLVVVTSPTYHGVATDIGRIAELAHLANVPLFVDQAWGAHFPFHPSLPLSAMEAGADACVTSPHKTLSAFSQGSMLLVQGRRIDTVRLNSTLRFAQSTSRNFPILVSLDATRRQMALQGWAQMELTMALAARARTSLRAIPGVAVIDAQSLGLPEKQFDSTRLVIDTAGLGLDGFAVERLLREEFAIAPEMSDLAGIVCLITLGDTRASIDALVHALSCIAKEFGGGSERHNLEMIRSVGAAIAPGDMAMTPRDAHFSRSSQTPLPMAVGRISAELVVPYPPGIPVLVPGERIGLAKLLYLAKVSTRGGHCAGVADPTLLTLRVVDNEAPR
ncbi:aminotransferase class I/II-fold pyridoxal phosphate-dependent enzyme [soil metagenome]